MNALTQLARWNLLTHARGVSPAVYAFHTGSHTVTIIAHPDSVTCEENGETVWTHPTHLQIDWDAVALRIADHPAYLCISNYRLRQFSRMHAADGLKILLPYSDLHATIEETARKHRERGPWHFDFTSDLAAVPFRRECNGTTGLVVGRVHISGGNRDQIDAGLSRLQPSERPRSYNGVSFDEWTLNRWSE